MKKKQPSNVFTLPNWMRNLRVREPEGTYTPDQVAAVLALNILLNGDAPSLRECVRDLVKSVPLKRQPVLKAFLNMDDSTLLKSVNEFNAKVDASLAQFIQEKVDARIEECVVTSGDSVLDINRPIDSGWSDDDDWDRSHRPKPSTRGLRALRSAKRQSAEA